MSRQRLIILLVLIFVIPIGFSTKFYSGPAEEWINNSVGGLIYEVFWCLVLFFLFPKSKPFRIALWVFIITCCLEFLQLWHPFFLETIRNTFIGKTLLGSSFNWFDFPYYIVGSATGYYFMQLIVKISIANPETSDSK